MKRRLSFLSLALFFALLLSACLYALALPGDSSGPSPFRVVCSFWEVGGFVIGLVGFFICIAESLD